MHTLFFPDLSESDNSLIIEGDEARHAARVKRLQAGDSIRVLNGQGLVATCRVRDVRKRLSLEVVERSIVAPVTPRVHVWSAAPKGARVETMIDALAQVGAASWTPMATKYGVVDPRETKLSRLDRINIEACKQAARPWLLRICDKRDFAQSLVHDEQAEAVVIADISGGRFDHTGAGSIRLVIGPEGGLTSDELASARALGAQVAAFGAHTMRIEVAAPVAAAIILSSELARFRNAADLSQE